MPKVPTHVVKDRSRRMTRLFEGFSPYAGMEGQEVDVSTTQYSPRGVRRDGGGSTPLPFPSHLTPPHGSTTSTHQVWVNSEVSQDGRHSVGHTKAYVKVLLPRDPALVGTQARVGARCCVLR